MPRAKNAKDGYIICRPVTLSGDRSRQEEKTRRGRSALLSTNSIESIRKARKTRSEPGPVEDISDHL
jgi:hypothetical protein